MNAKLPRLAAALAAVMVLLYFALPSPEAATPAPQAQPDYFAFVPSMAGTAPDGAARQDAAERLVVDEELGYLFEYYLAGLGERKLAAVRAEIERELDRRLRPIPSGAAKRLLDNYLAYKRALADLERGLPKTTDMAAGARARLEAMQQLRLKHFTPEQIAGLFGAADNYAADTIARLEISGDRKLSDAERKDKLAALDGKLPPALREQRDAPTRVLRLEESVQQARAQGAGEHDVYRLRAAALSPEAASRLAEVDREEADWQRRIAQYQAGRRQLPDAAAGAEGDGSARQALRNSLFSPEEQRRLGAYE
ncbi:lipase secretion chaperone [Pseudoduganella sp. LjRoot289]|uniref:lipase secretion chaperone n=1 Tax=Pseudoduganella sp. LjRoot289 TaxID=3342314 RepID=UPI003ECEA47D